MIFDGKEGYENNYVASRWSTRNAPHGLYEWTMNVEYDAYIRQISNPKYDRALKAIVLIYRDFYLTFLYQYQWSLYFSVLKFS